MNERIRELYKQSHITQEKQVRAGGWDNDREPFEYRTVTETNFDPAKFAELIVRECADVIQKEVSMKYKDGGEREEFMGGHYAGSVLARVLIKKHFGVEE